MTKEALIARDSFIGLNDCTWLYSGAETPPHTGSVEAINEYMRNRGKGPIGRERNAQVERTLRENLARMMNGNAEQIALVSNASEAITIIVQSLALKQGDNIVINTLEFPSGVFPALLLQEKGIEVRLVEHTDWHITAEDVMAQVDGNTKLVVASHVSFVSGARIDYKALYEQLQATNAYLLLDVTQSLGAMPVDMQYADFIVCSSYKWLMSVHGLGILAVNPSRTSNIAPASAGWRGVKELFYPERFESFRFLDDTRKFELGFPSFPSIYTMSFTTGLLLDIGTERIERHILSLGGELIERLNGMGYKVMTPVEPERRAGNISFACAEGEDVANKLLERDVYVWGGDGRIRASLHLFNHSGDIQAFVEQLSEVHQKAR